MSYTLDVGPQRYELIDGDDVRNRLLVAHQIAIHEPMIALLNCPDGSTLAIGLGLERSVLNFMAPGGWPSRHATDEAAGDERIQFAFAGQISEMPARGTVRLEDAIDACVHLVQTGSVTEKLKWQDD